MRQTEDVIVAPLITEKGSLLSEKSNQVMFRVRRDANKTEIKTAIEALFKVKVVDVRTLRNLGKFRRVGKNVGRLPLWKKAYVTLKEGDKIDFFGAV
ncbi:MAG: 50S ribosomal protein L23 [Candidatus Binatia bacterium]